MPDRLLRVTSSPEPFAVWLERDECCTIVHLQGELDVATVDQVEMAMSEAGTDGSIKHLIFDCHELAFIDSSGIRAFLAAHDRWEGRVALVHPTRIVEKAITVTGLAEMLNMVNTREEAKALLNA